LQNENIYNTYAIKTDHGGELRNERFEKFYDKHDIKHNLLASRTPHQNGVVEKEKHIS